MESKIKMLKDLQLRLVVRLERLHHPRHMADYNSHINLLKSYSQLLGCLTVKVNLEL